MQISESWLRTLVDPDLSSDALAHKLTMAGLEVEETETAAPAFSGVVAAKITAIAPHPDADRLRVCQVDDGSGEMLQIVCGAPNAAAGLLVPLARVGAELPGGMKIKTAKMRGVASAGMLCSARELGLSQEHDGLMLLPASLRPGQDLRAALDLDDTLITLKLTPNRADCLSILGVAREVAALTGAPLKTPGAAPVPVTLADRLPVTIEAADLCGRFAGRIVRGVNAAAQTPDWMKTRLERAGQRSVSVLVDISNYVMLELGRPSHIFDLDKVPGNGAGLSVRWAREGETLALLNGQTVTLQADIGVVAAGGQPESMAGIMGGEATSVSTATTNIYIESAFWWPDAIAGKARRYRFSSEASHRYERGVDFQGIPEGLEYITRLVLDICGGQAGPVDDNIAALPERKPVRLRAARCRKVLGLEIASEQIGAIFSQLGLPFERQGDDFIVTPPSFRFDIEIEEDLIEEVARIYGFENIPDLPPVARAAMQAQPEASHSPHAVRDLLASRDYQEVVNFSFVESDWESDYAGNADPIRLLNPIASHLSVMRSGLIAGLVANIRYNANRQQSRVRVFELGRVFRRDAAVADGGLDVAGIAQPLHLAAAAWGPADAEQWGLPVRQVDFYDVKRDLETLFGQRAAQLRFVAAAYPALHPGRSARVELDGVAVGWIGELHPRLVQQADLRHAPVVFELVLDTVLPATVPDAAEASKQPMVIRDLALLASAALSAQDLLDTVAAQRKSDASLAILKDVRLFDVWRDPAAPADAEKSLAFRFWLQDNAETLSDERVDACMNSLIGALQARGVRLRA
ncbi:phenylalanine--tRNA ligase subunit beta [Kerstersia sp.]|uniref:phenylalanine--tRNA ligase subunit beta n=1 Tax=Kerstersia sp. TaxID=1930783 RepID=UPI003F8EC2C9